LRGTFTLRVRRRIGERSKFRAFFGRGHRVLTHHRTKYEPNPTLFVETFNSHPDYLRNVHFSYVVLLRALRRGAPFLKQYNYVTGNR
jgi:hypothetical protein